MKMIERKKRVIQNVFGMIGNDKKCINNTKENTLLWETILYVTDLKIIEIS